MFTAVTIDGRTRAFYIVEPGTASLNDSTSTAAGTALNDKFANLLNTLDSIGDAEDMDAYLSFVEKSYNDNKNNPIGSYFAPDSRIIWRKGMMCPHFIIC